MDTQEEIIENLRNIFSVLNETSPVSKKNSYKQSKFEKTAPVKAKNGSNKKINRKTKATRTKKEHLIKGDPVERKSKHQKPLPVTRDNQSVQISHDFALFMQEKTCKQCVDKVRVKCAFKKWMQTLKRSLIQKIPREINKRHEKAVPLTKDEVAYRSADVQTKKILSRKTFDIEPQSSLKNEETVEFLMEAMNHRNRPFENNDDSDSDIVYFEDDSTINLAYALNGIRRAKLTKTSPKSEKKTLSPRCIPFKLPEKQGSPRVRQVSKCPLSSNNYPRSPRKGVFGSDYSDNDEPSHQRPILKSFSSSDSDNESFDLNEKGRFVLESDDSDSDSELMAYVRKLKSEKERKKAAHNKSPEKSQSPKKKKVYEAPKPKMEQNINPKESKNQQTKRRTIQELLKDSSSLSDNEDAFVIHGPRPEFKARSELSNIFSVLDEEDTINPFDTMPKRRNRPKPEPVYESSSLYLSSSTTQQTRSNSRSQSRGSQSISHSPRNTSLYNSSDIRFSEQPSTGHYTDSIATSEFSKDITYEQSDIDEFSRNSGMSFSESENYEEDDDIGVSIIERKREDPLLNTNQILEQYNIDLSSEFESESDLRYLSQKSDLNVASGSEEEDYDDESMKEVPEQKKEEKIEPSSITVSDTTLDLVIKDAMAKAVKVSEEESSAEEAHIAPKNTQQYEQDIIESSSDEESYSDIVAITKRKEEQKPEDINIKEDELVEEEEEDESDVISFVDHEDDASREERQIIPVQRKPLYESSSSFVDFNFNDPSNIESSIKSTPVEVDSKSKEEEEIPFKSVQDEEEESINDEGTFSFLKNSLSDSNSIPEEKSEPKLEVAKTTENEIKTKPVEMKESDSDDFDINDVSEENSNEIIHTGRSSEFVDMVFSDSSSNEVPPMPEEDTIKSEDVEKIEHDEANELEEKEPSIEFVGESSSIDEVLGEKKKAPEEKSSLISSSLIDDIVEKGTAEANAEEENKNIDKITVSSSSDKEEKESDSFEEPILKPVEEKEQDHESENFSIEDEDEFISEGNEPEASEEKKEIPKDDSFDDFEAPSDFSIDDDVVTNDNTPKDREEEKKFESSSDFDEFVEIVDSSENENETKPIDKTEEKKDSFEDISFGDSDFSD